MNAVGLAHLMEAMDYLEAHGITVTHERVDGVLRYVMDGVVTTEGDIVDKALALGMFSGPTALQ